MRITYCDVVILVCEYEKKHQTWELLLNIIIEQRNSEQKTKTPSADRSLLSGSMCECM